MNSKIIQALHSRTVWTVIVMMVFNLIPQLNIDQSLKDMVNGVLVLVAGYFHVNPNQIYAPAGSTVTQTSSTTAIVSTNPTPTPAA